MFRARQLWAPRAPRRRARRERGRASAAGKDRRGWSSWCSGLRRRPPLPPDGGGSGRWRPEPRGTTPTFGPTPVLGSRSSPTTPGRPHSTPASPRRRDPGRAGSPPSDRNSPIRPVEDGDPPGLRPRCGTSCAGEQPSGLLLHTPQWRLDVCGQVGMAERPFVDKPLVRSVSNAHSEILPEGADIHCRTDRGSNPWGGPGNRTDDRKAVGNGPGGGSTITSNRERRCASRRTVGPSGHFAVPGATGARGKRWDRIGSPPRRSVDRDRIAPTGGNRAAVRVERGPGRWRSLGRPSGGSSGCRTSTSSHP